MELRLKQLLLVGQVFIISSKLSLVINPVITQKYPLKEEIPEIRFITSLLTIIIKVTKVLLIK